MDKDHLSVGRHRPVYMWGGPGTIRMNRLKFMGVPVDEFVHSEAHTAEGAQRVADAGFNWAYLMYDWGFPPEVEEEDWEDFRHAVEVYKSAGMRTFGYIQTSNCVYDGSYVNKDWYARDHRGRYIFYYTGRYMTCWLNPDWIEHLREMVRGVIEAGADGVFFDNPWHASQPLDFLGAWMGGAGCYCEHCKEAFRQAHGREIPTRLSPELDEGSRKYLRWRADLVTNTLRELFDFARKMKPDILVSVNDFDAVMRPSYVIYGIDLEGLATVQDVLMIEDFGLLRWEEGAELLINNALTLHTAISLAGDTPVTTDPYDKGIGFDGVYAPRRFLQGIAEAAACGAPMVVKGTEFVEDGEFTLLTAKEFEAQRQALGKIHQWLEEKTDLYRNRKNLANVGLLFPGEDLWLNWYRLAPLYFGAGQTLLAAGIPWKVVSRPEHLEGLEILLNFGKLPISWDLPGSLSQINVPELLGWDTSGLSLLQRFKWLHAGVSFVVVEIFRAYFYSRIARFLLDNFGLANFFMQSPLYRLPPAKERQSLLEVVGDEVYPRVQSESPVLIEPWRGESGDQIHLVNYSGESQTVTVEFGKLTSGRVISPDEKDIEFSAEVLTLNLDVYAIVLEV